MQNETKDVLVQTHLTLMLGADNLAADTFIAHINQSPILMDMVSKADDRTQLNWMILYWELQLNSCGREGKLFSDWCEAEQINTVSSFVRHTAQFLCTAVMENDIPNMNVPLPAIN